MPDIVVVNIEQTLIFLPSKISKYRYMEANLTQKRASLEEKIPDIRKTLDVVEYLQERRVRIALC